MTAHRVTRQQQNLAALLHARSIAIVGISRPGRFGGQVYANLRNLGYPGAIFGVNPQYDQLYDQPCYPSLSALPDLPECAVLGVSNTRLMPALQEAADMGIPSAVIFASAYSEPSDGMPSLQDRLAEIARAGDMAVCGPNCMGFVSFAQKLAISGYPVIPDMPCGNITLISHSGSVFDALVQNQRNVTFNYAISPGNEMVTSMADYMRFAIDDPSTRVIALFVETARAPQGFVAALDEAARRDMPVVALKVGRSEQGAQLALAHSGALAGEDAVFDALFTHYGVRRVKSLDEMMDTLELFATGARAATRHVSAIFDSGGERSLFVDLAESEGVSFAPIGKSTQAQLAAALEPGLAPINPLDAWGTGHEFDRIYGECLQALDSDPATGVTLFVVDLTRAGNLGPSYTDVALAVQPYLKKPVAFVVNLTSAAGEDEMLRLRGAGIPVLMGSETGLRAVRHLLEYSHYQRSRAASESTEVGVPNFSPSAQIRRAIETAIGPLDEFASKQILSAYGIVVPAEAVVTSLREALQAAERIGYPVALKTAARELHKSDRDGVRLSLADGAQLSEAHRDMQSRLGPRMLVQQMVSGGIEILLGVVNNPQFGLMLAVGLGGLFVEVMKDSRLLMLPVSRVDVKDALLSLRGASLLSGVRGNPPVDVEAVVDAAMRLSALAIDLGDHIVEIDINPLIALPRGAVAVDALIVLNASSTRPPSPETKDMFRENGE
ncbi:MAG: acetate--CoA ligase family protein [Thermodesulfobacteriota bacterium]